MCFVVAGGHFNFDLIKFVIHCTFVRNLANQQLNHGFKENMKKMNC